MSEISARRLRTLFDAVYEMNAARDHADFVSSVLAAMSRLIPADFCHLHVIDRSRQKILQQHRPENPFTPEEVAYYVAHPEENALVAHFERTGDRCARRMSDVTDTRRYYRSDFYRNCLLRSGIRHTLALPIAMDANTVAGLAFDRRRTDFTPRHCALLDAFAPHFLLAWKRHENPWCEAGASGPTAREKLRALGLTICEADILYWMTEGKQNREIATILGRSIETVQEHVANIIRKLDRENRHDATVFALRRLERG